MKKCLVFFVFSLSIFANVQGAELSNFLEKKSLVKKIYGAIAEQDINFNIDFGDLELIEGINLSSRYKYEVESSYLDDYYSRVDKWDLKAGLDVGEVLKNFIDVPFSFSVNRNRSFLFVRQFKEKKSALKALPYTPKRLPINAESALKNLNPGDFVSMPANLNIAARAEATTSTVAPVIIDINSNVYWIVSGEFTIQVYKIDGSHVRLKLISQRSQTEGASTGISAGFEFFGVRVLDHQIDRLFDNDLFQMGLSFTPGSQFVVDYVFDLSNPEASAAYNQILSTTFKFKDIMILGSMDNGHDLKDKLISSYEKADKIFQEDKDKGPKDRRVSRVFKGFTNYKGHTRHLKMALLLASYKKDRTYTANRLTYIDKNENSTHFFYPTYSKYMETKVGKWFFEYKDQSFQNNFGLIPKINQETQIKEPDFGLTFERKDKLFTSIEQKVVQKFMVNELPAEILKNVKFDDWGNGNTKKDARITFQVILKSQGFPYLKEYSEASLMARLTAYIEERKRNHSFEEDETTISTDKNLKDFFTLGISDKKLVKELCSKLYKILKNESNDAEEMTSKLVKLNEFGLFDKIGVGFLISLLPVDQLKDLIYAKIDMISLDMQPVKFEYGESNYRTLYKELNELQSRLSNRSYDLRLSTDDQLEETSTIELN